MAHVVVSRERVVPASVDEIWARVDDLDRLAEWFTPAESFEVMEGQGSGRRQRMHGRWGDKRSEIDQVVSAYEPPNRLVWEHEAERLDGKPAPHFARSTVVEIRVIPRPEGCLVRLRSTQEPAGVLKGLGLRLLGKRELSSHLERSLENLPGDSPVVPGP